MNLKAVMQGLESFSGPFVSKMRFSMALVKQLQGGNISNIFSLRYGAEQIVAIHMFGFIVLMGYGDYTFLE